MGNKVYPFDISVRDVATVEILNSFDHTQQLSSEKCSSETMASAGGIQLTRRNRFASGFFSKYSVMFPLTIQGATIAGTSSW